MDDQKTIDTYNYINKCVKGGNSYLYTLAQHIIRETGMNLQDVAHEIFTMMLERGNIARMEPFTKKYIYVCAVCYAKVILRSNSADKRMVQRYLDTIDERVIGGEDVEDALIAAIDVKKFMQEGDLTEEEQQILVGERSQQDVATEKGVSRQAVNSKYRKKMKKFEEK